MVMTDLPQNSARKRHYLRWIMLVVILVAVVAVALNREWLYDWYRGLIYQPTAEMVGIREKLELTGRGEFLFGAAQPELNTAEEFNENCRKDESEVAVLGCYTNENIYVYNITDEKLDGIRELTTAHELLHAVWARMDESVKKDILPTLEQVYKDNADVLKEDIEVYTEAERLEEIFVRAGTEIKNLPDGLEKIYAEIFEDQDKIVEYYEQYIGVFRNIKARMEVLSAEMETLSEEINEKTEEYIKQANQLEADIVSFNSCAEVAGCFRSESDFSTQREMLIARQDGLGVLNDEINMLINKYNVMVDEYNADVTESHKLQDMINSNSKVEL